MARKKSDHLDGFAQGKSVSQEVSIYQKLKSLVKTDAKVYFIMWKYAPQLLPNPNLKTFDDLKGNYKTFTKGMTEQSCNNWLMEQNVQTAIKWLLKREHQAKLIELYNTYYDKAKEDTNAFKAFIEFSDKFFAEEKDSELLGILNGIKDDELE
ncbi:MAG: Leuk-A4-hydro-C domain-containing protein [Oscillospiraceae bacterium]|jgi:hypothetical protein